MPKKLIINADDFGMTIDISRGIIAAASGGVIRATSVITSCPDFVISMQALKQSGFDLDLGLHANLTWGRPISDPSIIPSLIDKNGCFLPRAKLLVRSFMRMINSQEAFIEIRAQAEKLISCGTKITHLDGHHHVHAFPCIAAATEKVALEFKIPYIRSPREGTWSSWQKAALRRLAILTMSGSNPNYWKKRGFASSDHFGGFTLGAGPNIEERWSAAIKRLPDGISEFMVHPGYCPQPLDGYGVLRESEIPHLSNPSLKAEIEKNGIEILSFKDVI